MSSGVFAFVVSALVVTAATHSVDFGAHFRFEILGDRTGEAVPGVFREALREADADHPDFLITVGDTIQGLDDRTAPAEWQHAMSLFAPYHRYPVYLTPGNHDVWSAASAELYERYSHHPLHYSFDYKQAHFTVLDDHDNDQRAPLAPSELAFLENDLRTHAAMRPKFVISHRPWWLLDAVLKNESQTQRLAERYGVLYMIAGHLHEMLRFQVRDVEYLSMPSAGGHLRDSRSYRYGWFFAHTLVEVQGDVATFTIKELAPPFGQSRVSHPRDWGSSGLIADQPSH